MPTEDITYYTAVTALHDSHPDEGIKQLSSLSEAGNADASYLLSRLYFKSKLPTDYQPDSIGALQNSLNLTFNDSTAHHLLIKAVDQNPKNYHALFDLACDYWKADQRTEAVPLRDGDKAESYYYQALTYAKEANDDEYVNMINDYLEMIKVWRRNLEKINSK